VINYLYDIPRLSSVWKNGVSKWVFDNWQLSGITSIIGGAPLGLGYSLVSGQDLVGASGAGIDSRVVLTGDPNLPFGERGPLRHFRTEVVQPPTRADFGIGTASKDPITGPGMRVFDVSLFKNIPFDAEAKRRLQLRFEFYNFLNRTNFTSVDTTGRFDAQGRQVNGQFGQYTASMDARRVVLGAKFYF
jgi:hypothetical protein